jgi:hypothetical protein
MASVSTTLFQSKTSIENSDGSIFIPPRCDYSISTIDPTFILYGSETDQSTAISSLEYCLNAVDFITSSLSTNLFTNQNLLFGDKEVPSFHVYSEPTKESSRNSAIKLRYYLFTYMPYAIWGIKFKSDVYLHPIYLNPINRKELDETYKFRDNGENLTKLAKTMVSAFERVREPLGVAFRMLVNKRDGLKPSPYKNVSTPTPKSGKKSLQPLPLNLEPTPKTKTTNNSPSNVLETVVNMATDILNDLRPNTGNQGYIFKILKSLNSLLIGKQNKQDLGYLQPCRKTRLLKV